MKPHRAAHELKKRRKAKQAMGIDGLWRYLIVMNGKVVEKCDTAEAAQVLADKLCKQHAGQEVLLCQVNQRLCE